MDFRVGIYTANIESLISLSQIVTDSIRLNLFGVPPLDSEKPEEIAQIILMNNAKEKIFWAADGHFKFMWLGDLGMSFRGLARLHSPQYLKKIIEFITHQSIIKKSVPSVFTEKRGFDMPIERIDSLPWLIYCISEYTLLTGDKSFLDQNRQKLQLLITRFEEKYLTNGLLKPDIGGDWMDTIIRPSSTWNNICILMMLERGVKLGFKVKTDPEAFERLIIKQRFKDNLLVDYYNSIDIGVDACVLALYLGLFKRSIRNSLIKTIELSSLAKPFPIKLARDKYPKKFMPILTHFIPNYHQLFWMHLGVMYLNGLKKNGKSFKNHKAALDREIIRHRNFVEVLDEKGKPYKTPFYSSAYGLSMAAAQYLELIEDS